MKRTAFTSSALTALIWWLAANPAYAQPGQPAPTQAAQASQLGLDQAGEIAVLGERIETVRVVADARISAAEVDYNAKVDVIRAEGEAIRAENNANFEKLQAAQREGFANLGLLIVTVVGAAATLLGVLIAFLGSPWLLDPRHGSKNPN